MKNNRKKASDKIVKKGIITISQAAEQAKMSVDEFKEKAGITAV